MPVWQDTWCIYREIGTAREDRRRRRRYRRRRDRDRVPVVVVGSDCHETKTKTKDTRLVSPTREHPRPSRAAHALVHARTFETRARTYTRKMAHARLRHEYTDRTHPRADAYSRTRWYVRLCERGSNAK